MATFTDAGPPVVETAGSTGSQTGDQSTDQAERKWKPGGRGRPPKGVKSDGSPEWAPDHLPPEPPEPPATPAALELRRDPSTYPRNPTTGLPIPLYRVTRTEDDLHNYLAAMRPHDWGHCEMYVYRYYPRARKVAGEPTYIDKVCEGPFDLDEFIRANGSGVYGFTLNDANVPVNRRTAMYAKVELRRDDCPEQWDLTTLDTDHKDNKKLVAQLIRDGIINEKGESMATTDTAGLVATVDKLTNTVIKMADDRQNRGAVPTPDPNAVAAAAANKATIEMLGEANKAAIAAVTGANKQSDPAAMLQLVTAIAGLVAPKQEPNTATADMIRLMMEERKEARELAKIQAESAERERQRNHELQMKALEQRAQQGDVLDQVEKVMKIKNLIGGGLEAITPRNWKEQAVNMVSDHLPQILEVGGALLSRGIGQPQPVTPEMAARAGGGVGGGVNPAQLMAPDGGNQPTTPQPQPQPPVQPQSQTTPTPAVITGPDGQPVNLTPEQQTQIARIRSLQNQIAENGRFLVNAIKRGQDGYTFAEMLVNMTDNLTYERARAYTHAEWMTAIMSFPQLQQEFAGAEPAVSEFVAQFLDWGNGVDDGDGVGGGDEDDDGGVVPATPPPTVAPGHSTARAIASTTPTPTPTPTPTTAKKGKK